MKRMGLLFMVMALVVLAGCAAVQEPAETTAPGPVTVSTVDELLAAIAPDTEILMEPGVYELSRASDYGCTAQHDYYAWEESWDGYELQLKGVQNLTIRGSGMEETKVLTNPRTANVLVLRNCLGVTLEDFTAGHTDGGECGAGVVMILGSMDVTLNRMGLFGCGITGVETDICTDITVSGCEIYECTSNGIWANRTDGLRVENCTLRNLGEAPYGATALWLNGCSDLVVDGCKVTDNVLSYVLSCEDASELEVKNTAFEGNEIELSVFDVYTSGMILDNCTFAENKIRAWFSGDRITAIDGIGKTWTEELLNLEYNAAAQKEPAGEQTEIIVSTVDELLAAIGPDTKIILKDGTYDLSTAAEYGYSYGPSEYYYWIEEYDGPVLVIDDVNNLTICSESGDVTKCTISAVPRYANVFNFRNCTNLTLSGFTAGHTLEPGECMGGVLDFERCDAVLVENCGLFGCGILGVQARLSSDISVQSCDIYECSYGGISMENVVGVNVDNCTFRDLGGEALYFYGCTNVLVNGEAYENYAYYD